MLYSKQKYYLKKSYWFFQDLLLYIISRPYTSEATVTHASQTCTFALLFLTAGN